MILVIKFSVTTHPQEGFGKLPHECQVTVMQAVFLDAPVTVYLCSVWDATALRVSDCQCLFVLQLLASLLSSQPGRATVTSYPNM